MEHYSIISFVNCCSVFPVLVIHRIWLCFSLKHYSASKNFRDCWLYHVILFLFCRIPLSGWVLYKVLDLSSKSFPCLLLSCLSLSHLLIYRGPPPVSPKWLPSNLPGNVLKLSLTEYPRPEGGLTPAQWWLVFCSRVLRGVLCIFCVEQSLSQGTHTELGGCVLTAQKMCFGFQVTLQCNL